jgi:methylated-DNA-[protein]-cysteine S-methyltransferase
MRQLLAALLPTPVAEACVLVTEDGALAGLFFFGSDRPDGRRAAEVAAREARGASLVWHEDGAPVFDPIAAQLAEYFDGRRQVFDLPLALRGTPFQLAVWEELRRIPFGATCTYTELARRVGRPAAVRAVGRANATNPVSLVVPCHRVVGADGTLTGYGGGLGVKRALLDLEGARRTAPV